MRQDVPAVTRRRRGQELHADVQEAFFRRQPEAPRRRRRRPLVLFLRRSLRVALTLAVPLSMAAWALSSPVFALHEIEYTGLERVSSGWVDEHLAEYRGSNLIRLPLDRLRESLSAHQWIRDVRLRKSLPDRLDVEVVEHRPRARLEINEGTFWVSEDGYVIAPMSENEVDSMPVAVVAPETWGETATWQGTTPDSVRAALSLIDRLAEAPGGLDRGLVSVAILGRDDFELRHADRDYVIRLTRATASHELEIFDRLLPQILARYRELGVVDLRYSRRIVLKPMGERFPELLESVTEQSTVSESRLLGTTEPRPGSERARG